MTPAELTQALAEAACRDTVLRAAQRADAHDAAGLAALFTADARLQRPGGAWLQGRAAIEAAYAARPASAITRHLVTGSVVDFDGADQARVTSQLLLWRGHTDDADGPQGRPLRGPQLLGRFDDLLRREADGRWRIAQRVARFELHDGSAGPAA